MKAKNTLVLQTIGMYVMHLPLYALIIINALPINTDLQNSLTMPLLIAALVLMVCILPICIINVITSFKSVLNEETELIKTTMVIKLCLIPWYALNFLIGFVFVSIFFNPFMMIAIPIIIVFLVSSTYLIMLTTSFGDIAYATQH